MHRFASLFSAVALGSVIAISVSLLAVPASGSEEGQVSQGSAYKGKGPHPDARFNSEQDKPLGLVSDEPTENGEYDDGGEYGTFAASSTRISKHRQAVRRARKHIGTRYRLSPPAPCRAYRVEDCSCHTSLVFKKWRPRMPDSPRGQWRQGKRIYKKSNVRPGDLVFFKENGRRNGLTHVGIYSGRGNIIHASSYFGKVVESKMKYIKGYYGAKRPRL